MEKEMKGGFDRRRSLQELEQRDWGEPTYDSYLVTTVHRLRRKPIAEFTVEDLRIMIGQEIGLPFLIPLAMERLEEEPLAAGDFYQGDLLRVVTQVGEAFWSTHPDSCSRICRVLSRVKEMLGTLDDTDRQFILEMLAEAPRLLTARGGA